MLSGICRETKECFIIDVPHRFALTSMSLIRINNIKIINLIQHHQTVGKHTTRFRFFTSNGECIEKKNNFLEVVIPVRDFIYFKLFHKISLFNRINIKRNSFERYF